MRRQHWRQLQLNQQTKACLFYHQVFFAQSDIITIVVVRLSSKPDNRNVITLTIMSNLLLLFVFMRFGNYIKTIMCVDEFYNRHST